MRHALLLSFVLAVLPVVAQDAPRLSESIDVPVTNVEVLVTKGGGERVTGLTKDDFEVLQGKAPREITNFAEIAAAPAAVTTPRRVLIAVDNMSLSLGNRKAFIAAAREFVERSLLPTDEVLVATFTTTAIVKQGWTRDRQAVLNALDDVAREAAVGRAELQRRRVRQELQGTLSGDSVSAGSTRGSTVTFDALTTAVRNYSAVSLQETTAAIGALSRVLQLFPRKPERKLLLVAGEGLPMKPGSDMWEYLESVRSDIAAGTGGGSAGMRRSAQTSAPLSEASDYDASPMIRALAADARRLGVMVYPVRPGTSSKTASVESMGPSNNSADFAESAGEASGYQLLARQTGGIAFIGAAPPVAFQQIASDLGHSYSLGVRATPTADEPLQIRSKSGHNVRFSVVAGAMSIEEQVEASVVAQHSGAPATNDLNVQLAHDPAVDQDGKRRVPLKVLIPVRSLTLPAEGAQAVGGFDVYISTGDKTGSASDVTRQSHEIRWPAEAVAHLIDRSVTFAVDVMLEKGRDQISVGVIDKKSKKTGFAVIAVP